MSEFQPSIDPWFLIAALVATVAAVLVYFRFPSPLSRWGGFFSLSMALDLSCYHMVLTASSTGEMQAWLRLLVIAYSFLTLAWTCFIFAFTGHVEWIRWRAMLVWAPVLAFAGGLALALPKIEPVWMGTLGSVIGWALPLGPAGYLIVIYTFGLGFFTLGLLIQMLTSGQAHSRMLVLTVSAGTVIVIVAGFLEVTGNNPLAPLSVMQLTYVWDSLLALFCVVAYRLGSVIPLARDAVFDHIQDGVLMLDIHNHVIDANPAALQLMASAEAPVIGKPLAQVWKQGAELLAGLSDAHSAEGEYPLLVDGVESTYDLKVSPVLDNNGQAMGQILVFRNVTARERMEKTLHAHARELTRTNKLITALSGIAARLAGVRATEPGFDTLGTELRKLGMDCAVVSIDPSGESASILYLSFNPALIHRFETLSGFSVKNHVIPRKFWPGDRILREKVPVWYENPRVILRRMFPQIPESLASRTFNLLGIQPGGRICMLPLMVDEKVIGAMVIWGADLQPADNPVLALFASLVGVILQNTSAYETEVGRANELARSNSMILALSAVAAHLESPTDMSLIFETVGSELKKLGFDCVIGVLDEDRQSIHIRYLSIDPAVIRWVEKVTGRSMSALAIPRHLWPSDRVVEEKAPYWDPNMLNAAPNMFPYLPESVRKTAMRMAGIRLNDPVCYVPLANEHDVIGVLAVWGTELRRTDVSTLNVLASQLTTAIRNADLYETESRRAKELGLLLEASEATSSSSQLSEVLLSLASKLLELSEFESCYISEWDRETNRITGLVECSRVLWSRERQDAYPLEKYPCTRQVLLGGAPVILQGEFETEEKQWMTELGRTAVMILALKAGGQTIGAVEIALTEESRSFDGQGLDKCRVLLEQASAWIVEPLSENPPEALFALEAQLLKASGGEVCSFSEWDRGRDCLLTLAVSAIVVWTDQDFKRPEEDPSWKLALYEGKTSYLVNTSDDQQIKSMRASSVTMDVESSIIFPLQKGRDNIGLIELYDFNHKRQVTPSQLALLRTVADKAGYSIQNARLLQQTQMRLGEKTALLNEKEILLKEVHHRVKNNLQVISSLLNLQSAKVADAETKDILRESQNRVRSMALIHEKLYQSNDLARVDFASYLQSLSSFLTQSYRGKADTVTVETDAAGVMLDIDTAIPCGLIVNELVSNSLKHAFPENRLGKIRIVCYHDANKRYVLSVSDDGIGLPDGFDPARTQSLGLKLVVSLIAQLEGSLDLERGPGTTFRIAFERMEHVESQHIDR